MLSHISHTRWHRVLFKPHLNSSIKDFFLYPLPLTTHLNSCIYSSIILLSCSTYFDSATFFDLSSSPPNSFFISFKISSTIPNSYIPVSKSSNTFSFQISAASSCTYDNTQCICSSMINNLHTVTNPDTFPTSLLNVCSITTFILNPVLDLEIPAVSTPLLIFNNTWSYAVMVAICFWYCWIIFNWFIWFSEGNDIGFISREEGLILVPPWKSNSSNIFVGVSRPSSCPISYYLLTTYSTALLTTALIKLLYYYP